MELHTENGQLAPSGAFKLIATGYLLGAGAIFVPLFVLIAVLTLATGASAMMNGQVVHGSARFLVGLMPVVLVPVVLALQAVMFGGLVVFGLWLYTKRRPIRVVAKEPPR